ncbi:XRE family transcriptional regulator [Catellatospora sp. KI3]|uniref:XRE family transcriptional regulator n=1 Tax=Catellatospora sp. KI3 TaxID=3041620 RepID=UPI0024829218|nr:XRE family transcriptional regulator [Catellatospora sp. KI3]MDI1465576.1 XRE family transcriptional regulator [Catellatospora sp. KI3]
MDEGVIDRVRAVITRVSPSQAAFSELVGISPDKLSKSLTAVRRFTSLELALIADAGDVSVDWLLTGRVREPVAAAAAEPPPGDAVRALLDRYAAAYDTLRRLGRRERPPALAVPPALTALPPLPPGLQGRELAGPAVAAVRATGAGGVGCLDTGELADAIERAYAVDVAFGPLPGGADAVAWHAGPGRLLLCGSTSQWSRQRFALAHALGHLLAGDAEQPLVDHRVAPGRQRAAVEARADGFASAFLMPYDEIHAHLDGGPVTGESFAALVSGLRVSPGAMAARLRALGLLDAAAADDLGRWTAARCHATPRRRAALVSRLAAARTPRLPARLVADLFAAYADGAATLVPLAGLLGIEVDELFAALVAEPDGGPPPGHHACGEEPAFLP